MARLARVVVPGMPHHITQRGNRRQQVFFNEGDHAAYVELLAEWCGEHGVEIWSYCLMRWVRGQTGTLHFRFHLRNSRESVFDDRQHVLKCKVPV